MATDDSSPVNVEDWIGTYCSEAGEPGLVLENSSFTVLNGSRWTCDVYFHDTTLAPTDALASPHALPTTGSGPVDGGNGMLPLALVTAAALAGLGLATRKVSIR